MILKFKVFFGFSQIKFISTFLHGLVQSIIIRTTIILKDSSSSKVAIGKYAILIILRIVFGICHELKTAIFDVLSISSGRIASLIELETGIEAFSIENAPTVMPLVTAISIEIVLFEETTLRMMQRFIGSIRLVLATGNVILLISFSFAMMELMSFICWHVINCIIEPVHLSHAFFSSLAILPCSFYSLCMLLSSLQSFSFDHRAVKYKFHFIIYQNHSFFKS